ncbi:MAG: inorganic phosphate transporter [Candidatus Obscuribacter sp.]|nr:inorganic phosphate transporter [Candidatus Obscuribacter sp.]MBK9280689.1 inorganic phosphate transporter [Candidatus Obscuribacter sp.]
MTNDTRDSNPRKGRSFLLLTGQMVLVIFLAIFVLAAAMIYGPSLLLSFERLPLVMQIGVLCIGLAIAFDFVNGFHDTANAVATVIYSGALPAWLAILMSAVLNYAGAMTVGTSVAEFIATTIPRDVVSGPMILATLLAGLTWNLLTWWKGLPVSSTHCLLGSLAGAGFAVAGLNGFSHPAVLKALAALIVSPIIGFVLAFIFAKCMDFLVRHLSGKTTSNGVEIARQSKVWRLIFKGLQIATSASVSFSHGANDGQKTMGLITLILGTIFVSYGYSVGIVPDWVKVSAALAIGLGTAIGGGRVIRTVGEKLSARAIDPVQGCAAEFTTAMTVLYASKLGVPASTTHVLTSSVVGSSISLHGKQFANWSTMKKVGLAWLVTLPFTALLAGGFHFLLSSVLT